MDFNSLEEALAYIKNANSIAVKDCSNTMKKTLEEEIRNQVTGYEGHLFNSVRVRSMPTECNVEISDYQGWTSLAGKDKGNSFSNAMYGLEGGYTWGREQTDIMEKSEKTLDAEIPKTYIEAMKRMGIPIE